MAAWWKYVALVVGAFLLLGSLQFILQMRSTGKLVISAPEQTPNNSVVTITVIAADGRGSRFELKPGETRTIKTKKGNVRVDGTAGNIRSVDIVRVNGWWAATKLTTPVGELRGIQKLGSGSGDCPVVAGREAFSTTCSAGRPVYRHMPLSSSDLVSTEALFDGRVFGTLKPYSRGYLGFPSEGAETLVYVDPANNSIQTLMLPPYISNLASIERPFLAVPSDPRSPQIALVFRKFNKVFIFDDIDDKSPTDVRLDQNIDLDDPKRIYNFQMGDGVFVLLQGNADHYEGDNPGSDGTEKQTKDYYEKEVTTTPQHIFEYSMSGELVRSMELPGGVAATSGTLKLNDSFYALRTNLSTNIYHYKDGRLELVFELGDITDLLPLKDKTYAIISGAIYVLEFGGDGLFSMRSLFASPAIRASGISFSDGTVVFTGLSKRSDNKVLDVFRLLDTKQTTPPFEETFPAERLSRYITGYDYDDKTIIFFLGAGGSSGPGRSQLLQGMKDRLKEHGVDVGSREVQIGPLN